jgi:20S proteasome subunit alpha 6
VVEEHPSGEASLGPQADLPVAGPRVLGAALVRFLGMSPVAIILIHKIAIDGAPRGPSFRNNAHSYKSSGASQSFTSGISSPSFNPQLPNGPSLSSFPSGSLRTGRHSHSFTYGRDREGTPKREEGSKKTLTDFRIIGVDCRALGWSWGTIVAAPDEPPSAPADLPETLEPEPDANLRPTTPTRTADAPKPSEVPTPTAPSSTSESLPKLPTETSRIRLYFNSPVEFEEKPAQSHPADRNRGGKRKKEHDEGEPEEGSKRKKEDADHSSVPDSHVAYLSIPPRPIDSTPLLFNGAPAARSGGDRGADTVHEPTSGIGAKRKAQSLSADDDVLDSSNTPVSTDATSATEHEVETEYAGSPHRPDMLFEEGGAQLMYSFDANEEPASESQAPTEIATDDDAHEEIGYAATSPSTDNSDMKEEELEAAALVSDLPAPASANGVRESQDTGSVPVTVDPTSNAIVPEPPTPTGIESESTLTLSPKIDPEPSDGTCGPQTVHPIEFPTLAVASAPDSIPVLPKIESLSKPPSANRISISYAGSSRRLVLDADIVQTVKIFRSFGRIEVRFVLERFESPLPMIAPPSPEGCGELVNATDPAVPDSKESRSPTHSDSRANTKPLVEGSVSVSDEAGDKPTLVESTEEPVASVPVSDSVPSPDVSENVEVGCVPGLDQPGSQSKDMGPQKEDSQRCRGILASTNVPLRLWRALKGRVRMLGH